MGGEVDYSSGEKWAGNAVTQVRILTARAGPGMRIFDI
jgi:hypothetical protein